MAENIDNVAHLPRWEELPDFELYLDQVLNLLDKYLFPFVPCEETHIVTASMINNYVKHQLLPPPVKKKYGRKHLAQLIAIGVLKQTLPLPVIKNLCEKSAPDKWYNRFCELVEQAFSNVLKDHSCETAMEMATLACAAKAAAEKLAFQNVETDSV
ncbi:DUF1836 domain-containing protein [uncultured Ruthenibacterium sp.]|uniref:DUF1836 domain-containing protein n=1 Tax=uncultured Ruthenibacterium sp. TaxID=1905347 RepID=UPI00349EAE24